MSVLSHLESLGSNLILTSVEKVSISNSISTLKARLCVYFNDITEFKIFGSYDRDVILPRRIDDSSDVDCMIVFNNNSSYTPQTYLNKLKTFAEVKYSRSEIFQSTPTIVLNLNHIKFELVPAYHNYFDYNIPAPSSSFTSWISTDPDAMKSNLSSMNNLNNFKIKPLVRIMKYWNVLNGKVWSSYELENIIVNKTYYSCYNLKDYFYSLVTNLNTAGLSIDKTRKVNNLKNQVREIQEDEASYPSLAESNLNNIFPMVTLQR